MADERPDDRSPRGNHEGQGRRGGRHRGYRGRHGGGRPEDPSPEGQQPESDHGVEDPAQGPRAEAERTMPVCPLCSRPVYDLSTALAASREQGDPAHFDCVLERVIASESLASGEKLVYLGSGCFGVVELKSEGSFLVKRRIQWEKEGEKKDWRRGLSSRIANL